MNMNTFVETLIRNATEEVAFKPFPHNGRAGLITPIIVVSSVSEMESIGIHLKKMGSLDFWNEIAGWFHSNAKCTIPHPVYVKKGAETVEIPNDIDVTPWSGKRGGFDSPIIAGAYVVDAEYNLYRIYGWDNSSGGSEIYFDFI